ncbi:MAG: hypothetical protein ACD_58C00104G0001 [uncultured bacterium]|nr:MAG: hypothetical protein ACD_58C00104G0001 [uncultured bacterium]OGT29893.1 MAG: hypothetical protein A3E87_09125 [Gammaproteobacteria bacterium RIFCSPHIGHO2_12_FULL_35_23]
MTQVNYSIQVPRSIQKITEHLRAILNSLGQLSRSPWASLLTFAVIGIALALPLSLFVVLKNIQVVSSSFQASGQINLYLQNNISDEQLHNTLVVLNMDEGVAKSQYISPQQGLQDFEQNSGLNGSALNLQSNPLPGVIVVTPESSLNTLQIEQLLSRLSKLPSITTAQLDLKWLQRLNAILAIGHRTALLLMIIFAIAVLLIIANTIHLTTQNHHDEILVIKLIGGTNNFIRRPFLYSGIIYGLVGAIFAWLLVDIMVGFLQNPITHLASLYGATYVMQGLGLSTTLYLIGGGILLGLIASWLAVSRYIYEIEPK